MILLSLSALAPPAARAQSPEKPLIVASVNPAPGRPAPGPDPRGEPFHIPDPAEAELARLINQVRAHYGLPPLSYSKALSRAAENHCRDMVQNRFVSHTGSGGATPWHRITRAGYPARRYGENVAAGLPHPQQVVRAWLQSPSHRKVLLSRNYREMGIGYVADPQSPHKHYWTLDLGARR